MKDRDAFLDLMVTTYETDTESTLSTHDPVFHAFNAVANVADVLSIYADKEARERYILTAKRRNSVIAHAIGYGYTPAFLEPDQHRVLVTFSGATPEDMTIPENTRIKTAMEDDEYITAEIMSDTFVPKGSTSIEAIVEVGETVQELIGTGTGQTISIPLDGDYVYVDSMTLNVVNSFGTEVWTKVDDFLQSGQGDQHFVVDVGAKNFNDMMKPNDLMLYIRCGDGISGKIFDADAQIYAVYRQVSPYQDTLPLNSLNEFEDAIMYVESVTNTEVVKEKVMPEDTEIIRRNAIYTKSIGSSLETKEDFERATILQSGNVIYKAYAESSIINDKFITTIYARGDGITPLSQTYLDSIRDLLYENFNRDLNSEYTIVEGETQVESLSLTIMFNADTDDTTKTSIKSTIGDLIVNQISYLDIGQTYAIPVLWNTIIQEAISGLAYIQINTPPPVVAYNKELKIPKTNISFTEA